MKTDNFDDAIRQKLENINPSPSEADIDRIQNFVKAAKQPVLLRTGIKKLIWYSSAATLVGGLLLWNIYEWRQQHKMATTIDSLKTQIQNQQGKGNEEKTVPLVNKGEVSANDPTKESNNTIQNIKPPHNQNIYTPSTPLNPILPEPEMVMNENTKVTIDPVQITPTQFNSIFQLPNLFIPQSIQPVKYAVEDHVDSIKPEASRHQPFSLKGTSYLVGLGFDLANGYGGQGITTEINLKKNWGLQLGARMINTADQGFRDEEDFHTKTGGHDFRHDFRPQVPDSDKISNIKLRYSVVQIPVMVSYRIPYKKIVTFILAAGTDIDLSAHHHIDFEHHDHHIGPPPPARPPESREGTSPVAVFNNATFSFGAQMKYKHLVFQLSPFVAPQLKTIAYKNQDVYAGLRFKVMYSFGG